MPTAANAAPASPPLQDADDGRALESLPPHGCEPRRHALLVHQEEKHGVAQDEGGKQQVGRHAGHRAEAVDQKNCSTSGALKPAAPRGVRIAGCGTRGRCGTVAASSACTKGPSCVRAFKRHSVCRAWFWPSSCAFACAYQRYGPKPRGPARERRSRCRP